MNRFFLSTHQISDDSVVFPADISHQLQHVLRLGKGDLIEVLDNRGHVFCVALAGASSDEGMTGRILSMTEEKTEPKTRVSLCFGLSNRDKVEWILQKGTEIGVSAFFPFISSRTLVQSTILSAHKRERWERIIREAAEQSHRGRLPQLYDPEDFEHCQRLVQREHTLSLIAWEDAEKDTRAWDDILPGNLGESIAAFVGPEGGFSEEEIRTARAGGCEVIFLGKRILRMETAALILPALILHEVGEF